MEKQRKTEVPSLLSDATFDIREMQLYYKWSVVQNIR